jgi:hypothetical protein
LTECGFAIGELIIAEILSVQIKQIESEKAWLAAPEQQIVEFRTAFGIDTDNFAVENGR